MNLNDCSVNVMFTGMVKFQFSGNLFIFALTETIEKHGCSICDASHASLEGCFEAWIYLLLLSVSFPKLENLLTVIGCKTCQLNKHLNISSL